MEELEKSSSLIKVKIRAVRGVEEYVTVHYSTYVPFRLVSTSSKGFSMQLRTSIMASGMLSLGPSRITSS